jgi:hypothetical protein
VLEFCRDEPYPRAILSAVVNGVVAVPVMFLLMLIPEKPTIVGKFVLPRYLRVVGVGRNRRHTGGVTWFSGDNGAAIVGALKLFAFPAILPYLLGAAAFTRCGLPTGGLCIS